jgi:hypothetical protein
MGHWYTKEGEPMHYIVGANGKERDTTLRDARKLNLLPSVTEIINILDKPALNNWFQTKLLYACLTLPRPEGISDDEFLKIVRQDASEEASAARDRGDLIHKCIEDLWGPITALQITNKYDPDVSEISAAAMKDVIAYCKTDNFTPEKTVAGDGYGGMIDLHSDDFVIDYKTKDIDDVNKKMAYPEHAMQLAAYEQALEKWPDDLATRDVKVKMINGSAQIVPRRCINVFIDRTEPGRVVIHEWKPEDIQEAWQKFELLLKYWQLSKRYFPE